MSKASPLSAVGFAAFLKLADLNSVSNNLPEFCAKVNLLCFPDLSPSLEKHTSNVNFVSYLNKNFTNYGADRLGGDQRFTSYDKNGNGADKNDNESNVIGSTFTNYGESGNGVNDNVQENNF